jgi:NADP-dependent 3-hydroxy acid dehydrogenase YdfG
MVEKVNLQIVQATLPGLLGKAFIEAIAKNGATAIISDISLKKGQQVKAGLPESLQANIDVIELDITNKESIANQIQALRLAHLEKLEKNLGTKYR